MAFDLALLSSESMSVRLGTRGLTEKLYLSNDYITCPSTQYTYLIKVP